MIQVGIEDRFQSTGPAGVVHQHIHAVQLGRHRVDSGLICDVRHNRGAADLVGQRLDPICPTGRAYDVKAQGGKGSGGRGTDPGAGARNDCDAFL